MKTAIKAWSLRITSFLAALFVAGFSVGAGAVIFTRSIEIMHSMPYTEGQTTGILATIGLALIWIIVLGADSAEHILKEGLYKANEITKEEN
jgi:hypothetical protein